MPPQVAQINYAMVDKEWIDINDESPIWYKPVLVYCASNGHMVVAWKHTDGEEIDFTVFDTDIILTEEVTHWQYLPESPK